ncbi:hypothetical protein MNBD_ALPHA05-825 [hydrothermal vent metagenome]|uniref:Uncharacterized protein n=1 Tax=hydrothermal vent metagenome TaxID=652676 RepID=A0A3B0S748_9ZZZZ
MAHAMEVKDARALQRLAEETSRSFKPARPKTRSRAALLEMIDLLSRWSAAGLALIAGIAVYMAIIAGRGFPARALAWTALLLCAVWVCRRMRAQFRAGAAIAARPFRWRASYTSCLSVLGVIFASAPILLTPQDAPGLISLQVVVLVMVGGFGAALFHAAHPTSAAAFAVPGALLPILAAIRGGDMLLTSALAATSVAGLFVVFTLSRTIARNASRRNPRTRFVRREIEPSGRYVENAPAQATSKSAI